MKDDPLTPEERAAVDRLLENVTHPDEVLDELEAAFGVSETRRAANSHDGGLVIAAYHRLVGSWKRTSRRLGAPISTLRRWSAPYRPGGER